MTLKYIMKKLADYFKIVPLSDFQSFDGQHLITISGKDPDHVVANNNLNLVDEPETGSRASSFYKQSLRAVSDKLTDAQRKVYVSRRPVVVLLFTDDGAPVLWGNADQKLRITITPTTDADIMDFKRSALVPLF